MTRIMSTGMITIVDMHDAPALQAWISASQTTRQTYNNTLASYSPNYASTPQVLTLDVTRAGATGTLIGAQIKNVKWFKNVGSTKTEITSKLTTDTEYKSGTSDSVLTTKVNTSTTTNATVYTVEGLWADPVTKLDVSFSATIDIALIQLAKAAVIASLYAPNGDFFRNNTPTSLSVNCDVFKDGAISNGSRKYKFFAADSSIKTSQDSDAGIGWRKIIATTGSTGETVNAGFDVAVTIPGVLTVFPDAVVNAQTYLVVVTDNAGGTSGTKMKQYITLRDMDDPIVVNIDSTNGDVFKNGIGSTTLNARLFQNGDEIDTGGTIYTYTWTKWENNVLIPNFGGTGVGFKSGKTLAVGSADVNSTTTFKCEVSQ